MKTKDRNFIVTFKDKLSDAASETTRGARGFLSSVISPDYLPRRVQKEDIIWTFFDLGTRLRSVATPSTYLNGFRAINATESPTPQAGYYNEYVEIMFDALGRFNGWIQTIPFDPGDPMAMSTEHLQVAPKDAGVISTIKSWDRLILGAMGFTADEMYIPADTLDPFQTTEVNGESTRQASNCMPIWYGRSDMFTSSNYSYSGKYPNELFDIKIYQINPDTSAIENISTYISALYREIIGDLSKWNYSGGAAFAQAIWAAMTKISNQYWTYKDPQPSVAADENWNTRNLTTGSQDISKAAQMVLPKATGNFHVNLEAKLFYESFDTGSVDYKVTEFPYYGAAEVPFNLDRSKATKFYLKPSWLAYMKKYSWSRGARVTYETYRGVYYSGSPRVNLQDGLGYASGTYYFTGNPNFNADAGPFTFTGTFTLDAMTGAVSHTYHAGTLTGTATFGADYADVNSPSYTLTYNYKGPNYSVQFLEYINKKSDGFGAPYHPRTAGEWEELGVFPGRMYEGECSLVPHWNGQVRFPSTFATIYRGCHIGRCPVFPHTYNSFWYSVLSLLGDDEYTYTATNGTGYVYDPQVAKDKLGYITYLQISNFLDAYNRHVSKNEKDLTFRVQHAVLSAFTETGTANLNVTNPALGPQDGDEVAAGTGLAGMQTAFYAEIDDLVSQLEAFPHVRNVVRDLSYNNVNFYDLNSYDILPIDAEAELLCGVIWQGETRFFIWRKEAESRGGQDYDRNQAAV